MNCKTIDRVCEKYNKIRKFEEPKFVKIKDYLDPYSKEFWYFRYRGEVFEVVGMRWDNYITHPRHQNKSAGEYGLIDNQYICRLDCEVVNDNN